MSEIFEPKIIGFLCNWCSYAGADLAGTSHFHYPENVRIIKVPCSGRIDPLFVVKSLLEGIDGVIISGCHPGDCHYLSGNYLARRRFIVFKELLEFLGISKERLYLTWVSAAEGDKWARIVTEFTNKIKELGPNPYCKGEE